MQLPLQLLIVCPLVFLGALIDAIAGGGGLITLPAYHLAGLPPHTALGTNKLSSSIGASISTARFLKNRSVHLLTAAPAVLCALLGSAVGARLAMLVSERGLQLVLVVMLPLLAVFLLTRKNGYDVERRPLSAPAAVALSALAGLVIGAYDGFFGPGTGTFLILIFTFVIHLPLRHAMGNAKVVNFASNIAALLAWGLDGKVVFALGLPAAVCSALGSYIGAGLALRRGAGVFKPVLIIVLALLLAKIVLDLFGIGFQP